MIDYLSCILFRIFGFIFRCLPVSFSLFLGRRIGDLVYYLDVKHRSIAYANIKQVFGAQKSPRELRCITQAFYHAFGSSMIEVFFIPFVDKKYMEKYIRFEGREHIEEAFKKKKGVLLLGVHAGSWELSNIICANLGFPFSLLVREQKFPRLNALLNAYRTKKGCRLIERKSQTRQLIEALKNNEAVGLTADQGDKNGCLVDFFGREASMPTGAVKLALKYAAVILPAYYARIKGPYIKTIIEPPFEVKNTGDEERDIRDNVQALIRIFEKNIEKYPADYLWIFKIWKYARKKRILILSDAKTGHLRQSQAVASATEEALVEKGSTVSLETVEVKFKNKLSRRALHLGSCLSGKYNCQGCLRCLKAFLLPEVYKTLVAKKFDFIISCGASLAPVNYLLSRENLAKSIAVMRPSFLSTRRFDAVVMPRHDHPPVRKNVVVSEGALNVVTEAYLKEQSNELLTMPGANLKPSGLYIGVLIGGDAKHFTLTAHTVLEALKQAKLAAEKLHAELLVTTSRRTSKEIEDLVRKELQGYYKCVFLVIANEKNYPFALGGILGLSSIVVTSPESISMISEAVASRKYVVVFNEKGLSRKHKDFLENSKEKKYIHLTESSGLTRCIEGLWQEKPAITGFDDHARIKEALKKIL